jgi:outer membrane protein assembly factor BamB
MTTHASNNVAARKGLRLWPGVVLLVVLVLVSLVAPAVAPNAMVFETPLLILGILGGVACGLAIMVWWLLFSRAPWSERLGAIALMVVALAATYRVVHESIAGGMMGNMLYVYSIPVLGSALVLWAVISRGFSSGLRRASMVAAIVLACGAFTLVRTDGVTGDGSAQLQWRWTPTAEQQLLSHVEREHREPAKDVSAPTPAPSPSAPAAAAVAVESPAKLEPAPANTGGEPSSTATAKAATADDVAGTKTARRRVEWPGFRGPDRDGIVYAARIQTDWNRSAPVELWRRPIGPGWSSFAVDGDFIYTQEQRGDEELVSCYRLTTGEPVWRHRDAVRFYESNGGAGPRGTPTLHDGRVYTFGATGIVNALDATTGAVLWSRNAAADTGVEVPEWGFASSPLVIDDVVVVAASGRLVAYDAGTGNQRWLGPSGGAGYSSPHLVTIDGVHQILLLRGSRTISVAPADGTLLWEHVWQPGVGIVQPAQAPGGDVLLSVGDAMGGLGVRRVHVSHQPSGWTAEERWTSRALKPYFNDFVVHKGHAFGFDGSILACMDINDGARKWKGGRYGHGQMVLLPEQDVLLVVSEDGELALVKATSDQFTELARIPALNGKTWNHPVVVGDVLLVRNGEEMVAFRLPRA